MNKPSLLLASRFFSYSGCRSRSSLVSQQAATVSLNLPQRFFPQLRRPLLLLAQLRCPLLLLPLLSLLFSCETDYYDKGTGKYSLMQAELVEVYASAPGVLNRAVSDEGVSLTLTPPFEVKWATKTDSAYRALLYYNKVVAGAEPIACSQVGTAVILPLDSFKNGVRQDPVRFESAWVSKTGRYLNTSIYLMTGEAPTKDNYHLLAVADDSIIVNTDSTRTQRLRLYHNQGGMPEHYSQRAYFSIPLHNVKADSISLSVNTYNGVVVKKVRVR